MLFPHGRHSSYQLREDIDRLVKNSRAMSKPSTLRFNVFNTIERDVCVDHMKRYPEIPYFCVREFGGQPWDGVEYDGFS